VTPDQIPDLLKQVSYADPRILSEDPQEIAGLAGLWAVVLADVPAEFAMQAVGAHYAKSPYPIKPSDISTRWQALVHDRMSRHTGTFEPSAHPELDPDDEAGYRRALAAERRAVVMGQQPPTPLAAITAGPAAEEVERRMAALGDYMPRTVRDALAPYRPAAAARVEAIREGRPDALAIACPVETCRAATKQPCTAPRRGGGRRRLSQPHPSRLDAAEGAAA